MLSATKLRVAPTFLLRTAAVLLVAASVPGIGVGVAQDGKPTVDYILPWRVAAGSSRVRVTVHGDGLADCSLVTMRRGETERDVPAHLRGDTLVFTVPDELAAAPGEISVRVGAGASASNPVRLEVVKAATTPPEADPFISKVAPVELEVPASGRARLLLHGEHIDPQALVLFRREGQGDGGRLDTAPARGKARLEAWVRGEAAPESSAYEVRVVNPTARMSNWVRVVVTRR